LAAVACRRGFSQRLYDRNECCGPRRVGSVASTDDLFACAGNALTSEMTQQALAQPIKHHRCWLEQVGPEVVSVGNIAQLD
jgi:hypothetical protein